MRTSAVLGAGILSGGPAGPKSKDACACLAISEVVGAAKPDPRIFRVALDALAIPGPVYGRVVMVGNNLERDVAGANRLGLISVFYHLNERRRTQPLTPDETPQYTVTTSAELYDLIMRLEKESTTWPL